MQRRRFRNKKLRSSLPRWLPTFFLEFVDKLQFNLWPGHPTTSQEGQSSVLINSFLLLYHETININIYVICLPVCKNGHNNRRYYLLLRSNLYWHYLVQKNKAQKKKKNCQLHNRTKVRPFVPWFMLILIIIRLLNPSNKCRWKFELWIKSTTDYWYTWNSMTAEYFLLTQIRML